MRALPGQVLTYSSRIGKIDVEGVRSHYIWLVSFN